MRVALADVGRCGRLDLVFAERDGRTALQHSYCEVPFKITRPLSGPPDGRAHLMLMHCTAGLFGGDRIELTVRVERGARVRLTQQSATRVHPSDGRLAVQCSRIQVEREAELEMLLEPVIPFEESRLSQQTLIEMDAGARLIYWEGLMAGRVGRGELWTFDELSSETKLMLEDRLLFLDRLRLQPTGPLVSARWGMGTGTYSGTGLYVGEHAARFADALREAMPAAGVDLLTDNFAATRVVTSSGPEFHRCREIFATR
ncbi:MAG TPA: urease accessory protein UreD [Terriglobia bacterium]|nr:urease accessory protein UreD [Terriglobia bacterium]